VEIGGGPWSWPYGPVPGARVVSLAVDDHGPGEHEAPDAGLRHGGEQHGGAQVVARDVLRRVGDALAEPDHGGLVADGVHAGQGAADGCRVRHVGAGIRAQVEHGRFVSALLQGGDDLGSDEAGAAGDQYAHAATLGPRRGGTRGPRPYVTAPEGMRDGRVERHGTGHPYVRTQESARPRRAAGGTYRAGIKKPVRPARD